jgi:hypothetical protein
VASETFHKVIVARFLGDDNRLAIRKGYEWFNMESLARVLVDFGEEYTAADKSAVTSSYEFREKASLLKRVPYYHVDINKHVGLLQFSVLTDMLNYTIVGKETEVIH